jgi:hypothetical protein
VLNLSEKTFLKCLKSIIIIIKIGTLLELIELIFTQKDEVGAFEKAIFKRKINFVYFDYLVEKGIFPTEETLLAATKIRQIEAVRFILVHEVKLTLEVFQYASDHVFSNCVVCL